MTRIRLIQKKVRIITNYIYQNIIKMKMIIKGKEMKEKGLQNNKVMQDKKKNIQNIKEVEKAMIKDLLRRWLKSDAHFGRNAGSAVGNRARGHLTPDDRARRWRLLYCSSLSYKK
jgi:hypothetical protein